MPHSARIRSLSRPGDEFRERHRIAVALEYRQRLLSCLCEVYGLSFQRNSKRKCLVAQWRIQLGENFQEVTELFGTRHVALDVECTVVARHCLECIENDL